MPHKHLVGNNPTTSPKRSDFTRKRRALSSTERHHAMQRAALHLPKLFALLPKGTNVALYYDDFGELPTAALLHMCARLQLTPHLPVVIGNKLKFAPIIAKAANSHSRYAFYAQAARRHRLGMYEPVSRSLKDAAHMAAIFLPLVAVDAQGMRLGMGGGYYDRTLSVLRHCRRPLRIGWCYDFQRVGKLANAPWDIGVHLTISPSCLSRM